MYLKLAVTNIMELLSSNSKIF